MNEDRWGIDTGVPQTSQPLTPGDVAAAHAQVRADPAIQFDLPAFKPPVTPDWLIWLSRHMGWANGAGRVIFWIVVACAAILLVLLLVKLARRWRPKWGREEVAEIEAWHPEVQAARRLLGEADALAAAGQFAAAARLLLHRSLEDVARHRPALVRPAATTREIAGAAAFPVTARAAFSPIAGIVERSLFGGRDLTRADWDQARTAYADFALPGAWA